VLKKDAGRIEGFWEGQKALAINKGARVITSSAGFGKKLQRIMGPWEKCLLRGKKHEVVVSTRKCAALATGQVRKAKQRKIARKEGTDWLG